MKSKRQRLLVSVRGPVEAIGAAKGGAHIADVEFPASALGTPYPMNIDTVCSRLRKRFPRVKVSTNIGEIQHTRANACQAALGVACAGADLIKFGLGELPLDAAVYQGESIVRTVRRWFPRKKLFPAVFVDDGMDRYFNALDESVELARRIKADGILIDTFEKGIGKGLLDYHPPKAIRAWCKLMHMHGKEAWLAGSITLEQLPVLWAAGADVICVRGAACNKDRGKGRFAEVDSAIVRELVATIP
jgi:uncharacterized protein (UPF0264 family)